MSHCTLRWLLGRVRKRWRSGDGAARKMNHITCDPHVPHAFGRRSGQRRRAGGFWDGSGPARRAQHNRQLRTTFSVRPLAAWMANDTVQSASTLSASPMVLFVRHTSRQHRRASVTAAATDDEDVAGIAETDCHCRWRPTTVAVAVIRAKWCGPMSRQQHVSIAITMQRRRHANDDPRCYDGMQCSG